MSRKSSSGFVSAPSINPTTDDEAGAQLLLNTHRSSLSSAGSSKLSISSSFKSLVENHTKPLTRDYNEFATSYLCEHVPLQRIICEDSESVEDVECKFSDPVPIQKYFIQEKSRQEFGPSVRQKYIIPSSQIIWNDIRAFNSKVHQIQKTKQMIEKKDKNDKTDKRVDETPREFVQEHQERQERLVLNHLLFKARQWCEVNKALAMDNQFPKPDPNVVRKKYSQAHQKAIKLTRKECGKLRKEPIFQPELAVPFTKRFIFHFLRELQKEKKRKEKAGENDGRRTMKKKNKVDVALDADVVADVVADADTGRRNEMMDIFVSYAVDQKPDDESSKNKWNEWAETVKTIFDDVTPLEELQSVEPHWQTLAEKSRDATSMERGKKCFFKRNIYPPMTLEDYITEKRKLLPPIKPEYLQTDYLSGIWEPELMLDTFNVTPLNYDSRLVDLREDEGEEVKISWDVSHEAKQKCWQWLRSIPENL